MWREATRILLIIIIIIIIIIINFTWVVTR